MNTLFYVISQFRVCIDDIFCFKLLVKGNDLEKITKQEEIGF